jgi:hypothetical protein
MDDDVWDGSSEGVSEGIEDCMFEGYKDGYSVVVVGELSLHVDGGGVGPRLMGDAEPWCCCRIPLLRTLIVIPRRAREHSKRATLTKMDPRKKRDDWYSEQQQPFFSFRHEVIAPRGEDTANATFFVSFQEFCSPFSPYSSLFLGDHSPTHSSSSSFSGAVALLTMELVDIRG